MSLDRVPFYRSAAAYDDHYGAALSDIPFWLGLVERLGARQVLELGCGSGRLTLPLARALAASGGGLVGLDRLPAMLAGAAARLAAEPEPVRRAVRLVEGDMRAFALDDRFDLIALPFNTLGHLHGIDEQMACLTAARRHLAPGGRLAVDVILATPAEFAEWATAPDALRIEGATVDPATGGSIVRYRRRRYRRDTQTVETDYLDERLTEAGPVVEPAGELRLHLFFPRELELLFRLAGYRVEAVYGDRQFGPLTDESMQLIMVGVPDGAPSWPVTPDLLGRP